MLALTDPKVTRNTTVKLLGYEGNVSFKVYSTPNTGLQLDLRNVTFDKLQVDWAWTFALENVH